MSLLAATNSSSIRVKPNIADIYSALNDTSNIARGFARIQKMSVEVFLSFDILQIFSYALKIPGTGSKYTVTSLKEVGEIDTLVASKFEDSQSEASNILHNPMNPRLKDRGWFDEYRMTLGFHPEYPYLLGLLPKWFGLLLVAICPAAPARTFPSEFDDTVHEPRRGGLSYLNRNSVHLIITRAHQDEEGDFRRL